MSQTLLRFGLWIVLIVLAGYVVRETFSGSSGTELLTDEVMQRVGGFGVALLAGGVVLRLVEKTLGKAKFRHCTLCRQPVAKGELYCRVHLRQVIDREQELSRRRTR